ncbi:MAG: DUF1206 domain-containing protein [Actinomycetales bacterium]
MTEIAGTARRASNGTAMNVLARFGLACRGFVYVVIGWLAFQVALGHGQHQANQTGALAAVAQHSFGELLLWVLGLGFAAYAIWRLSQAAFGTSTDGDKAGPRLKALVRGLIYAGLAVVTFNFVVGTPPKGQRQQQVTLTARLLKHDVGRWAVAAVGLVVVAVGVAQIVEGLSKRFTKQLQMHELTGATRTVIVRLGVIGTTARGVVFALAGGLVVDAALTYDAAKSTGLDGALRTLADQPYGPWLLGAVAVGLVAFGVFGLASARYAKT